MKDVAVFKKVSKKQFGETFRTLYPDFDFNTKTMDMMYDHAKLPTRATSGSVGYDFVSPFTFTLHPGTKVWIPTGIRVEMLKEDFCLAIMPNSRFGKNSIRLSNTIGIIDADYYFADNEGHIIIVLEMIADVYSPGRDHLAVFGRRSLNLPEYVQFKAGDKIGQGLFLECGMVANEDFSNMERRTGGFGSTGN